MKNEHNQTSNRYIKTLVTQQMRSSTVYVLFLLLRSYIFPHCRRYVRPYKTYIVQDSKMLYLTTVSFTEII
jgi:hypothetical protein